jgi:hypothetical protein
MRSPVVRDHGQEHRDVSRDGDGSGRDRAAGVDRELRHDPVVRAPESRASGDETKYQKNDESSHVCRINADKWGSQDGIG